jgi:hypothetical protein
LGSGKVPVQKLSTPATTLVLVVVTLADLMGPVLELDSLLGSVGLVRGVTEVTVLAKGLLPVIKSRPVLVLALALARGVLWLTSRA